MVSRQKVEPVVSAQSDDESVKNAPAGAQSANETGLTNVFDVKYKKGVKVAYSIVCLLMHYTRFF